MFKNSKFLLVALFMGILLPGCAVHYSKPEIQIVDDAIRAGNPGDLRGKLLYLYQQKDRKLRVEQAAINKDPSGLSRVEMALYNRQIKRKEIHDARKLLAEQKLQAKAQKDEQNRLALAKEEQKKREKEEELAAIAKAEEAKRQAEAQRLASIEEVEKARQRKRDEKVAFKQKISEPLHQEWDADMAMLADHFKSNGYEPAQRLASVYARTMQFLVHASPDTDQFNDFFSEFSDTEKLDHRRMFHNEEGQELLAEFWSEHERAGELIPGN